MNEKNNQKTFTSMNNQTTEGSNTLWSKYLNLRMEDYEKLIAKMNQILVGKNSKEELPYEKNKKMEELRKELKTLKSSVKAYLQGNNPSHIGKDTAKYWWQRLGFRMMDLVPMETLVSSFSKFIEESCNYGRTKLVRILTFPTPKGEGFFGYKRCWYEDLSEYAFEDMQLPGAKDYDGYLKVKYGNYMKLPPEDKRKVHPISKLTLLSEQEGALDDNGKEV